MNTDRRLLAAAFLAITFFTAGPARAAVNHPTQIAPAAGTTAEFLPAFAWTPVPNADKYEFQIAADPGMNSGVLGGGKKSGSGSSSKQGGTTAQKKAAGRKGGKAAARKS